MRGALNRSATTASQFWAFQHLEFLSRSRTASLSESLLAQFETLVSGSRDLIALVDVRRIAEQRHEYARLTRNVGAQVPRVARRVRENGLSGDGVDVVDPSF